jgi:peptide/nickel transport system substrate-binding protein/oligopeptide transport system substrate-binding protein
MTSTRLRLAAGALVLTLALSACSSGGSDDDATTSDGGDLAAISVAVTDPQILIPGRQTVAYDLNMAVWSSLTWVDDAGEVTMLAAESVESDDATTWTITLKDGWTFQDGTPVTAQSYVDSWNAVAYGPNAFENTGQLANVVGYGDLNPAEGEPTTTEMSGLAVVDGLTFTVELSGPDGQFPMQLSQGQTAMYPMPESAFADFDAYNTHPIGNGAFQVVGDYVENETLVVEAYPDYAGPAPTVDQISFVPYTDQTTAYTDVQAGNIDIAGVPAARLPQAATDFPDTLYSFEAPGISYLGLPLSDPRYQDVRVRRHLHPRHRADPGGRGGHAGGHLRRAVRVRPHRRQGAAGRGRRLRRHDRHLLPRRHRPGRAVHGHRQPAPAEPGCRGRRHPVRRLVGVLRDASRR